MEMRAGRSARSAQPCATALGHNNCARREHHMTARRLNANREASTRPRTRRAQGAAAVSVAPADAARE
eukprot:15474143-Alexandrium_andersonii.AAC.1